ncbi:hypothetical protein EJD97_024722 [Solanum chilense]|uniref:CCHC-type domain-containing protein n=1 Tax=Solanum chilense TaxID=4083 RepID=A0A6N2C4B7_SOLCI|nr:hypothetical protein EJD97_024722 [Solanum chilense]
MSHFVTGVTDLVKEEYRTTMLHDDMTVARLMVYAKSIEESKLKRMATNLKRVGYSDHEQTRVKNRAQTQEEPRSANVKFYKGGESQNEKPTCSNCGNRHFGKCLAGTRGCYGCGKDNHNDDSQINRRFCALRARGSKPDENDDDDDGKSLYLYYI